MSLEKTLVILKPSAVQRGLIGEITHRFERKGLRLAGMKMMQLTEDLLNEHYAHLAGKPFFSRVKASMMASKTIKYFNQNGYVYFLKNREPQNKFIPKYLRLIKKYYICHWTKI